MLLDDPQSLNVSFTQVLYVAIAVVAVGLLAAALGVFATNRRSPAGPSRHWISRAIYGLYLILIVALAATGLGSIVRWGHMSGYALLLHLAAAGGFVFLMVAMAVLYLPATASVAGGDRERQLDRWWAIRWSAWALVLSSLVTAGTMLVSMLPVLDTTGLLQMAMLHRYAGLAVVIAACVHLFSLTCVRLGWR